MLQNNIVAKGVSDLVLMREISLMLSYKIFVTWERDLLENIAELTDPKRRDPIHV